MLILSTRVYYRHKGEYEVLIKYWLKVIVIRVFSQNPSVLVPSYQNMSNFFDKINTVLGWASLY